MSNISFVRNQETPVPGVTVESVDTAVASAPVAPAAAIPSTSLAVVPQAPVAPAFFDDGNIDFRKIIVPRINVVQKVGDLSNIFTPGYIVLNQSTVIHIPDDKDKKIVGSGPLVVIPIGSRPLQYAEKIEGGGRGLFFNTEAEVAAANGTLNYKEWEASLLTANPKKRFEEYATFLFLFKKPAPNANGEQLLPDNERQVFTQEIDGEFYAIAQMGLKGVWYTGFAKRLYSERKFGFLKDGGYASFNWNVSTFVKPFANKKGGTNFAVAPIVTNGTRNTPAFLSYVKDSLAFG